MDEVEQLKVWIGESDRILLEKIVKADGTMSMSATVRALIRNEAKRRGIEVKEMEADTVSENV